MTFLRLGTCTIRGSQRGTGIYLPVTKTLSTTVVKATPVLTRSTTVNGKVVTGTSISVRRGATVVHRLATAPRLSGLSIEIWWKPANSTWRRLAVRRLTSTGTGSYSYSALFSAQYRWRFTGNASYNAAWSATVSVTVR